MNTLHVIKEALLDLFFPSSIYCLNCNQPILENHYSLCPECTKKINWVNSPICEKCGKPLNIHSKRKYCMDCMENPHIFTQGFSCSQYDDIMSNIIKDFKFNHKSYYAKPLAHMLFDKLSKQNIHYDIIIPVPLHKNRKKTRGYNQSELLAYHLSHLTGIPAYNNLIIRKRDTTEQNKLSKSERHLNIKDAFHVTKPLTLRNKSILLIDDVYTTGSTMDACASSLTNCNCHHIYFATCCTGLDS